MSMMRKESAGCVLWTERSLSKYQTELATQNYPPWRQELHESFRRQNCPTFSEARATVRYEMSLWTKALRTARVIGGHLTERGVTHALGAICRLRAEHSSLIQEEASASKAETA